MHVAVMVWLSGNSLVLINIETMSDPVSTWMDDCEQVNHPGMYTAT